MARAKKRKKISKSTDEVPIDETKVPIPNLPDKFLWMKVKSGTKIRNVLEYSLKEFSRYDNVVWSGAGQGIGKVITCAEIFKRKISGLRQITKLRYVQSKNPGDETVGENAVTRVVPEIHVLLSKNVLDTKEPGYQAPDVCPMFQEPKVSEGVTEKSKNRQEDQGVKKTRMSDVTAEEFASMGLRTTAPKRPRRQNEAHTSSKKPKNKSNNENK